MDGPARPRRVVAIVNTAAGPGISKARFMEIRQALHGEPFGSAYLTLRRGHGEEWARTFRNETGYIVFGGDGSLHEIVSGMDIATQRLAIVPMGTAVSLGRDLGNPTLADACGGIETDRKGHIDLLSVILRRRDGTARRCRAVASLAVGWPADVARVAARWRSDLGALAYPVAAAVLGLNPRRFEASLRVDGGRWSRKAITGLLVGNTRHVMTVPLFPDASPCDGRMEVLETSAGPGRRILHGIATAARVYLRLPLARASLHPVPARRLSILLAAPCAVAVDGESYEGVARIELRLLRGGLRVFLPVGREP